MPSKRVKTYGRSNNTESHYIPKPVSPFKITEASNVIDALFSKNIRKRNSSPNKNVNQKKTRGRPRKSKISELPLPVYASMLDNDSLDIKINSTFDNLLQGPVYNQVNVCNKSSLYVSTSTDTSNSKIISEKLESNYNTRKKKKKNYVLYSDSSLNTWEKSCNNSVLPNGKIRKKKNNPRKLKQIINNVVINISDTTTDIPKKLHSYLDHSINYSLIIDRQSKQTCAKKYTPIASTSNLFPVKNHSQDNNIFRPGFRHLMRAENTPRYIHSSTPIVSRNINIDDKLNVSPITASAKTRLNFTSYDNSKSLFDSKKINDVSSIKYTANKNNASSVISINTTVPPNVSEKIIIDDTVDNNSLIPIINYQEQSVNADEDKIVSNVSTNSFFIANDIKLNAKPVVLLDRYVDVIGINGNASIICRFSNYETDLQNELTPFVRLERPLDDSAINRDTENSRTDIENILVPVVYLERLSLSKYLKNNGLLVTSRSHKASNNSQNTSNLSSASIKISDLKRKTSKFSICNEESTSKTYANENTRSLSNNELIRKKGSNIRKTSTGLISSGSEIDNEHYVDLSIISPKSNSKSRSSSNKYLQNNCISTIEELVYEPCDMENTARSMFSLNNSDIIECSINDAPVPINFVTDRKKRVHINSNESIICTKPPNINSEIWKRVSQSKINLVRMEDCKELEKYSKVMKTNDNQISSRKTHINMAKAKVESDLNRKSIFLKPGKKWFRSLSILRQTNLQEIEEDKYCNKGKKWRETVFEVFKKQNDSNGAFHEIGDESVVNDMKHQIRSSKQTTLGIRKSLKIVNISVNDCSILAEVTIHENKSGYVPSLAHVSILESFDKLSLSTNVDDREETARQIILKRCGQTDPIPFDDCYSSRTLKKCRKIGEGVYGEVFMYKSVDNKCRVMKVIPIEGNLVVNGEHQKKFEEIISEIIIASELSNLRMNNEFCTNGYAELLQVACVQGKYPQHLLDLWDLFDEERGSENDSPEIFTEDQLYIVLELANGGQDLEAYRFSNAEQSYALFVQVVCSLAVAESAVQFEHRDMHWGNILISPTDEPTTTFRHKGREFEVATRGVKVSLIDFTLSRMTYNNCCIYNDLALDPDLFTATGDYQFDIYRLMKQRNQNDWQAFEPYTNILWLDYTLDKMINHVRYLRVTTKTHKSYIRRLSQIKKKILNYNSATELLNSDVFSNVFL